MGRGVTEERAARTQSRHLRWEAFEARIAEGPPSVEPVKGAPKVVLFIEPRGARIGLRISSKPEMLPASPLAEVSVREIGDGVETLVEVSTSNPSLFRDFYAFCCAIADRVQLDQQPVGSALAETLRSWSALLRRKSLLSEDRQIGLLGELIFLIQVAAEYGWALAAAAWYGPDSEEHDFTLPRIDVEVKTTRAEARIHEISSLTQLLPKMKRPLVLLSIQLTVGADARESFSLPEMVAQALSAAMSNDPTAGASIREQLSRLGWLDEDAPLYGGRFQKRGTLVAIPVDDAFPAIVPATLKSLGPGGLARIRRVSYLINVEGLGVSEGTRAFRRLLFVK